MYLVIPKNLMFAVVDHELMLEMLMVQYHHLKILKYSMLHFLQNLLNFDDLLNMLNFPIYVNQCQNNNIKVIKEFRTNSVIKVFCIEVDPFFSYMPNSSNKYIHDI